MSRTPLFVVMLALVATALAGCLGGGDEVDALPTAVVDVEAVNSKPDTYLFDASASTGRGLAFAWDLGDGTTSTEAVVEHTFAYGDGVYPVSLIITDLNGVTALWTEDIKIGTGVNGAPVATFTLSARYLAIGEPLTVDARTTLDPEDDPLVYEWDFNFIPMDQEAYIAFREAKMVVEPGSGAPATATMGGETEMGASAPAGPIVPGLRDILGGKDAGHCHGVCNNEDPPSFDIIKVTTNEPVHTLAEGFPSATTFYVKLVAKDIKGGFQRVLSEEIFPVKVVETKEPQFYIGGTTGTFTVGGPDSFTNTTPDIEDPSGEGADLYDDEYAGDDAWKFDVPNPPVLGFVNVTWSAQSDAVNQTQSNIAVYATSPAGKERYAVGPNTNAGGISIELLGSDQLGAGTWTVEVYGRLGVAIEWTADYWFHVDLNPFRDLEAPYL